MLKLTFLVLIQVILILIRNCDSVPLPQWVWRVNSCPDPDNITQWKEASKRINCFYDLTSKDPKEQERVYHCLPSTYMNESVEFCGRSVPIAPGNCPVYNYKHSQNKAPSYYNCNNFTTGCPKQMFFSKEVYKYPMCLKIKLGCYEADLKCINKSTSTPATTVLLTRTTRLESSFKPNSSNNDPSSEKGRLPDVGMNPVTEYDSGSEMYWMLPVVGFVGAFIAGIIILTIIKRRRLIKCLKKIGMNETHMVDDETQMKRLLSIPPTRDSNQSDNESKASDNDNAAIKGSDSAIETLDSDSEKNEDNTDPKTFHEETEEKRFSNKVKERDEKSRVKQTSCDIKIENGKRFKFT
ncbi:uncharacterized protein LOC134267265 [Saccostrea cucullata]|uniref:uncharacterized protein LOC134267265 n=1 Tax=Saccostrea cuccullata TaxID=36930 RepID=UPI002ED2F581